MTDNGSGARAPHPRTHFDAARSRRNMAKYARNASPTADGRYRPHVERSIGYDRAGAYEKAQECFCVRGKDHGERLHG